jgi:hypothetical protein
MTAGDALLSYDGQRPVAGQGYDTGHYETVYNIRVQDCHTYFVGDEDWGFSVWAHNTCNPVQQLTQKSPWSSLRWAMKATAGWIAHHIIPVSLFNNPLVQAAAKLGFEVNRRMNGVLLTAIQHTVHPVYNQAVKFKLNAILARNGGLATPAAVAEMIAWVNKVQAQLPGVARIR